ncbi:Regulating synaptic membrane exocytosis protein 4 [Apodemus speciosus]|uniref:Regulating synaptic membrane exocytosis protein 4 n=1 Tax=Apodemus speciosus TaxID=105296 RepID=A0ABQ0EJE1_APOSI
MGRPSCPSRPPPPRPRLLARARAWSARRAASACPPPSRRSPSTSRA